LLFARKSLLTVLCFHLQAANKPLYPVGTEARMSTRSR
jgi:hypothetical protein